MDPRTQERVEEWDSRPFSGGFDGLSDLADADFSGAVSGAGTWLFMLNGRIVGVFDGDVEDFETASGTRYEAPHPSLPLLCTMEERGGETRAKYYTNETPLREVDQTLQSGSFTGYIELSENVLSGDYYAVYYGGRRMAAAYIGNAERLHTGEEAFERAADEVGIYEVTDVEIDVTDVPGTGDAEPNSQSASGSSPEPTGSGAGVDAAGAAAGTGSDADSTADPTGSPIEPIDVSNTEPAGTEGASGAGAAAGTDPIEDVTIDDSSALTSDVDLTGDPTETEAEAGMTTDQADPDPDAGADATPPATSSTDEPADASVGEPEPAADQASAESTDSEGTETAAGAKPAHGDTTGTDAEAAADADADTESPTDPDLSEVEAAAEELDQHISWVEDEEAEETEDVVVEGPDVPESTADDSDPESEDADDDLEEQFEREEQWRETRRIPSIDPDKSQPKPESDAPGRGASAGQSSPSADAEAAEAAVNAAQTGREATETTSTPRSPGGQGSDGPSGERTRQQPSRGSQSDAGAETGAGGGSGGAGADTGADRERIAALTEQLETLQEQRDALATKAEELTTDRDRLRSENEELSATVERLRSRIDELETELRRARERDSDTGGAAAAGGTQLSPAQALSGTNLFVRYASKSKSTLETAHNGNADRSDVSSNLRLEHHTPFDSGDAVVDGDPYEEFLTSTMEFRFVEWLTERLLYEIRDTGHADGLADLYDAIPRIDRAELGATISLEDDDTEDVPDQVTFDVVAFDKMGNPLVLATLNDSREPASQDLLEELEAAASAVKANYPDLAATMAVTSSYFEPGALEVAEQATSGGLLSRGSNLSYVNLSRKSGYHLCLAESRSEGFHMNVPEL
ncbi:DUF7527 domain-containing protein [Natrinema salifodinae]|uniref:DUF7527 domain-containing protein n=1 Tax=Natrinema salifodinae TaxID=1202768 RepID=A0A1I0NAV3_9EURY|nr:transcriptional regulator [Natrinema salifodinae]SEV98123.1 hypothetical protein SAMN05216285_1501 [Natrinema salifodinae]